MTSLHLVVRRGFTAAAIAGVATVGALEVLPEALAVTSSVALSVLFVQRLAPSSRRPARALPPV